MWNKGGGAKKILSLRCQIAERARPSRLPLAKFRMSFPQNPSLPASLPWLANEAAGRRLRNGHILSVALILFVAPIAVFAAHLATPARWATIFGFALAVALIVGGRSRGEILSAPVSWRRLGACLLVSLALCAVGGQAHMFFAASDWFTRDAVVADLVLNKFPVFYHYQGEERLLRAPLGMYMTPALIGWAFGLEAAHFALLGQNALLLAAILYLANQMATRPGAQFLILLVLFSPGDVIPRVAIDAADALSTGSFVLDPLTMFWNPLMKYWGHTPSLFWAPNHALPAWLFVLLLFLNLKGEIDIALLALASVVLLFWSPLAMVGALPFLAIRGAGSLRNCLTARNLVAAAAVLALAPIILYLTLDSGAVSREWLFLREGFWKSYLLLLIFAIPHAFVLLARFSDVAPWLRPTLIAATVLLMVMPFYRIGVTPLDNDMAMRCTLAPLFALGFVFADTAQQIIDRGRALGALTFAIVILSAYTGLMEIRRGLFDQAYRISDCNLATSMVKVYPDFPATNYFARAAVAPEWLIGAGGARLSVEKRACWPDYPPAQGN